MKIDQESVYKLADLARIALKEEEALKLIPEMNKILGFMDKLNEVDTSGVEPLRFMLPEINRFRADVVQHQLPRAEVLKNSMQHNDAFFRVPKILEK